MDPQLQAILKTRTKLGSTQDVKVESFLSRAQSGTYSRNRSSRSSNSKTFRNMQAKFSKNAQTAKNPDLAERKSRFAKGLADYINGIPELASKEVQESKNKPAPAAKEDKEQSAPSLSPPRPSSEDECSIEPEGEVFAVKDATTKDDGNCFYSAIYRAAKEQGVLDKFPAEIKKDTEENFIQSMRNRIAFFISKGILPKTKEKDGELDSYNALIQSDVSYSEIIRGFPSWFRDEFPKEQIGT